MKKVITVVFLLIMPLGASAQIFGRDLRFGLRNDSDVTKLQEFLTDKGFYSGPITGNFFSLTLKAVKKFQNKEGIKPVSGYVGVKTRERLNALLTSELEESNQQAKTKTGSPVLSAPKQNQTKKNDLTASVVEPITINVNDGAQKSFQEQKRQEELKRRELERIQLEESRRQQETVRQEELRKQSELEKEKQLYQRRQQELDNLINEVNRINQKKLVTEQEYRVQENEFIATYCKKKEDELNNNFGARGLYMSGMRTKAIEDLKITCQIEARNLFGASLNNATYPFVVQLQNMQKQFQEYNQGLYSACSQVSHNCSIYLDAAFPVNF